MSIKPLYKIVLLKASLVLRFLVLILFLLNYAILFIQLFLPDHIQKKTERNIYTADNLLVTFLPT